MASRTEFPTYDFSPSGLWPLISASAAGTTIEWYDFYIFGSLAVYLSPKFYPAGNNTIALVAYLSTFAVGFVVRPFGALFFGRIGDLVGRKYAFLVTLSIMGGATTLIGLLPTFETAGWFAPIALLLIRVLQGLALGGEYGGAAVYIAEHVPDHKRGFYTSFIQTTATCGLLLSLLVVLATEASMTPVQFAEWGWRFPFLFSLILVSISVYLRLKMRETPLFAKIKTQGRSSRKPIREALLEWSHFKRFLISLLGATMGQGVIWYTGQFYALYYLQTVLNLEARTATLVVATSLLLATPFFLVFGALSDRIGRKWLMMAACLLAVFFYLPIYHSMQSAAGNHVNGFRSAQNPVTGAISLTPLTRDLVSGLEVPAPLAARPDVPELILLVFLQVLFVAMIYGPIAAYLVETFPARIRYTGLSISYHIGNGVFGGLLPLAGTILCARTGNIYAGLYYPIAVAATTFVVGGFFLKETHGTRIWDEFYFPKGN